jgi:hypothetical protein
MDEDSDCQAEIDVGLVELAMLGVPVTWASWLPTPVLLADDLSLAVIDRSRPAADRRAAVQWVLSEALDAFGHGGRP